MASAQEYIPYDRAHAEMLTSLLANFRYNFRDPVAPVPAALEEAEQILIDLSKNPGPQQSLQVAESLVHLSRFF